MVVQVPGGDRLRQVHDDQPANDRGFFLVTCDVNGARTRAAGRKGTVGRFSQ